MIYLIQIINMLNKKDKTLFTQIFNDLDYELTTLGYSQFPEDLIEELLSNHFNIQMTDPKQLQILTDAILKYQLKLDNLFKTLELTPIM